MAKKSVVSKAKESATKVAKKVTKAASKTAKKVTKTTSKTAKKVTKAAKEPAIAIKSTGDIELLLRNLLQNCRDIQQCEEKLIHSI